MNILLDIGHPAHVHVFRHFYHEMTGRGHRVICTTKQKECTLDLLESFGMEYHDLGKPFSGAAKKVYGLWHFGRQLLRIAKQERIDLFMSVSSMYAAQVSALMGKKHIVLDDTEHSGFEHWLYRPFSDLILTPNCFEKNMGRNHLRYDGYHELAYLHPNRFTPNPDIRKELGLHQDERFVLLRFVSWNAGHDISQTGLDPVFQKELVEMLQAHARVLISSEKELPTELESLRIDIRPEQMHDALHAADLYVGEGASMASECAMIGTPAVYVNSLDAGTLKEQEAYGLLHGFRDKTGVAEAALAILLDKDAQVTYRMRMARMLEDKIDVTRLLVGLAIQSQEAPRRFPPEKVFTKLDYDIA